MTDPVAYTHALAREAVAAGTEIRTGARVEAIARSSGALMLELAGGDAVSCRLAVNCCTPSGPPASTPGCVSASASRWTCCPPGELGVAAP